MIVGSSKDDVVNWRASILAAALALAVGCGTAAPSASVGEERDAGTPEKVGCNDLCALVVASQCAEKLTTDTLELCVASCDLSHADSVPACEPSWDALVVCLSGATMRCMLQGACDAEDESFGSCVQRENPCAASGAGAPMGVAMTGLAIDVRELRCGCPPALRDPGTSPATCLAAVECPERCCGCSAIQSGSAVAACVEGQCADEATACARAEEVFGTTSRTACP